GFHVCMVGCAVSVRVEVLASGILDIFQKAHQMKGLLQHHATKAEILVIAPKQLIVEVDVKELSGVMSLRDSVQKVQACHVFVCDFGVYAYHLRVVERVNEGQHVPHRRKVH